MDCCFFSNDKYVSIFAANCRRNQWPQAVLQLEAVQESQLDLPPAKADISFLIFFERHLGHETSDRVSIDRKRSSNSCRHLLHLNSYIGISHITFFLIIYGMDG
jgi:hypothetical protein